jgi:hypothetical protein
VAPAARDLLWGAPDRQGGWIFHSGDVFWRIDRDGSTKAIAKLALPTKGVTYSNPVVLENGDLWFALNADSSSVVYTDADAYGNRTVTDSWHSAGDRPRWIRLRPDGRGGLDIGEIDGDDVLEALKKLGAKLEFDNLFVTPRLRVDYSSKGIVAYETSNDLLFVLEPK